MLTITLLDGKLTFIIVYVHGGLGIISGQIMCICMYVCSVHMHSLVFYMVYFFTLHTL